MKLTLKIQIFPDHEQSDILIRTIREANAACNAISEIAWDRRVFNKFKLQKEVYYPCRSSFKLGAQMVIRSIAKVSTAYRKERNRACVFRPLGGIAYDHDLLRYLPGHISIWSIYGRLKMPFTCHKQEWMPYIKGEADLVYRKGKFYLFQTVEVPDEDIEDVEEFIGVDFGLTDIAVTSDGVKHSAEWLNAYREHRQKARGSIQSKGTKGAKRLLKRLSGKERTTAAIINHTIAKSIVLSAKEQGKGIAIEDLTGIRFTSKRRNKTFRSKLGRWSFFQLRQFMEYKARLNGVKLVVVEPAYTSKTCSGCHSIGIRTNKKFDCKNCGHNDDADFNASKNIATLGAAVNQPEKSTMFCSLHR